MYKVKKFFRKILRVIQFIPLAWRDEDWDYDFLIELIKFKCEKMRTYFRKTRIISEADAKEIIIGLNRTLWHIDCYRNPEKAYKEEYGEFNLKVGHRTIPLENGLSQMISTNSETGKDLTQEEDKTFADYCSKVYKLEDEHFKGIFKTIADEGQKWWD